MAKAPTVEDVAAHAGVSRQTVSNVLNTPDIVRPATRERVLHAIDELGYRRHAAARRLRLRRSSTIGIRLDPYLGGISGVVLDRFVHAITERASARGMRMLVYAARTPEEELGRLAELWEGSEIDAAILTGTVRDDPRVTRLDALGLPFISFGRPWGDDDIADPTHLWVDVDGAAGTRAATRHALERGAEVAFLGWPTGSGTGDDRERGWREALAEAGARGARIVAEDAVPDARRAVARAWEDGRGPTPSSAPATRSRSGRCSASPMRGRRSPSSGSTTPRRPKRWASRAWNSGRRTSRRRSCTC